MQHFDKNKHAIDWINTALREICPESFSVNCKIIKSVINQVPKNGVLSTQHAAKFRKEEFSAGRSAACEALSQLGLSDAIIPAHSDRSPIWPQGFVGSIAHAANVAVAVVAKTRDCRSIGIDIELASAVTQTLWSDIMIPAEINFLASLPECKRVLYATVIFSIKEAFYKFQYPHTFSWMEFNELAVTLDLVTQTCSLNVAFPINIGNWKSGNFEGRYRVGDEFVLTTVFA